MSGVLLSGRDLRSGRYSADKRPTVALYPPLSFLDTGKHRLKRAGVALCFNFLDRNRLPMHPVLLLNGPMEG